MTSDIVQMSMSNDINGSVPMAQRNKTVEGRLWGTLKALAETEGKIYLLSTLNKMGLATNDVKWFAKKQVCHRKVRLNVDNKILRTAMHCKVIDACAHAKRLRQNKNIQKNRVLKKYQESKAKGRQVVKDLLVKYNQFKLREIEKAKLKIVKLKDKDRLEKSVKEAPGNTNEILSGVNIFREDHEVLPQAPLGPMVCDSKIQLNKNELELLSRGPKYMVRDKLSLEDFTVELEKMIAKQKLDNAFNRESGEDDLSEEPDTVVTPARTEQTNVGNVESVKCKEKKVDLNLKWEENKNTCLIMSLKNLWT